MAGKSSFGELAKAGVFLLSWERGSLLRMRGRGRERKKKEDRDGRAGRGREYKGKGGCTRAGPGRWCFWELNDGQMAASHKKKERKKRAKRRTQAGHRANYAADAPECRGKTSRRGHTQRLRANQLATGLKGMSQMAAGVAGEKKTAAAERESFESRRQDSPGKQRWRGIINNLRFQAPRAGAGPAEGTRVPQTSCHAVRRRGQAAEEQGNSAGAAQRPRDGHGAVGEGAGSQARGNSITTGRKIYFGLQATRSDCYARYVLDYVRTMYRLCTDYLMRKEGTGANSLKEQWMLKPLLSTGTPENALEHMLAIRRAMRSHPLSSHPKKDKDSREQT